MTSETQSQEMNTSSEISTQTNAESSSSYTLEDEVDLFLKSSGKYARLPPRDGETKRHRAKGS